MRKTVITVIFVAIAGLSATLRAQNDFEIVKNVDIFINVLNELNQKYADEISPGELTQTAIKATPTPSITTRASSKATA